MPKTEYLQGALDLLILKPSLSRQITGGASNSAFGKCPERRSASVKVRCTRLFTDSRPHECWLRRWRYPRTTGSRVSIGSLRRTSPARGGDGRLAAEMPMGLLQEHSANRIRVTAQ